MSESYKDFIATLLVAGMVLAASFGGVLLLDRIQNPERQQQQDCQDG